MQNKFIGKAIKKPGALHSQLGVSPGQNIPSGYFSKIMSAKVGDVINLGGNKITVTALLKKRASLGQTLVKINKK